MMMTKMRTWMLVPVKVQGTHTRRRLLHQWKEERSVFCITLESADSWKSGSFFFEREKWSWEKNSLPWRRRRGCPLSASFRTWKGEKPTPALTTCILVLAVWQAFFLHFSGRKTLWLASNFHVTFSTCVEPLFYFLCFSLYHDTSCKFCFTFGTCYLVFSLWFR